MNEKKKQTIKYFVQQKAIELVAIPVIVISQYKIGYFILSRNRESFEIIEAYMAGFFLSIIFCLFIWINWLWAKERAEKNE